MHWGALKVNIFLNSVRSVLQRYFIWQHAWLQGRLLACACYQINDELYMYSGASTDRVQVLQIQLISIMILLY